MGSYVFRWAHAADEVFVTGTFDDWGKTVKLEKIGDVFEKEVDLPEADGKVHYKFVVDGSWITDKAAREEEDGFNNINNVLLPEEIKKLEPSTEEGGAATLTEEDGKQPATPAEEDGAKTHEEDEGSKEFHILPVDVNKPAEPTEEDGAATLPAENAPEEVMAGVSPDSTTPGLAAQVPKESEQKQEVLDTATISSAAPESTTAELAKDVPLENKAEDVPGTFPETPAPETSAKEPEQFSVNPLPATNGIGNPIHLQPGEKVPDPSTFTSNTVESTVSTDQAGYERDASAPVVSGLTPAEVKADASGALNVPPVSSTIIPESSLPMNPPAADTTDPGPTIQSAAPNSSTTELAAEVPLEEDKDKDKEKETNGKVEAPAAQVPDVVKKSLEEAHAEPEAAANEEAVEEKIEVDDEFLDTVKPTDDYLGQPAPTASAIAAETVPRPTEQPEQQPLAKDSSPVSAPQPAPSEPTVTTGVASAKTTEVSEPKNGGLTRSFTRRKDKKDKDKDNKDKKDKKEKKEETETDADGKDKKKVRAFFTKIMRANTIRGRFNQVKESKEIKEGK